MRLWIKVVWQEQRHGGERVFRLLFKSCVTGSMHTLTALRPIASSSEGVIFSISFVVLAILYKAWKHFNEQIAIWDVGY